MAAAVVHDDFRGIHRQIVKARQTFLDPARKHAPVHTTVLRFASGYEPHQVEIVASHIHEWHRRFYALSMHGQFGPHFPLIYEPGEERAAKSPGLEDFPVLEALGKPRYW